MQQPHRQAFTLVELSIVLVILGLLVGGVLAGQSLIRAAELRSVTTEYQKYVAATNAFRDKYFALPGDMSTATSFWGTSAACPGAAATGSTTPATCNGNGDGIIYTSTSSSEIFRFWHHLANAGLIEGTYSGVTDNDGYFWSVASSNSPKSKLSNAIWTSLNVNQPSGGFAGWMPYQNLGNLLMVGGVLPTAWPYAGIMTPSEAWNIDTKVDDGNAIRGKVMAKTDASCTNVVNGGDTSAAYVLTATSNSCYLLFVHAF